MTLRWLMLAGIVLVLGACKSEEPKPEPTPEVAVAPGPDEDSAKKNEVRLQLDRSIDQYWQHHIRQEYGTADGIATVLARFVKDNYDFVRDDLHASSPRWRKNAAAALGFADDEKAIGDLMIALQDPYQDVVLASLLSLWNFAKREVRVPVESIAPYLSHKDADIRSNAAMVLSHSARPGDGQLFLPLTSAMEDPDPTVRSHAAAALGSLGDAGAVPFLIRALEDEKVLVRIRAAFALGRLRDPRAIPHLIDRLDDPEVDVAKASHKALTTITKVDIERNKKSWEDYWADKND